jgi:hypothetical protein
MIRVAKSGGRGEAPAGSPRSVPVGRIVLVSVAGVDYRYELRRGDEVVATGHLSRDEPLEIGDRLEIGGQLGIVRTTEPMLGEREVRLVVQLVRDRI